MPTPGDLRKKVESFPWDKWAKDLKKTFEPLYEQGADIGAQVIVGEGLDTADPFVDRFMTEYVGERIVQLQETTKARVSNLIRRELEKGSARTTTDLGSKILSEVSKQFEGYKAWRANTIARTETGFAYNHGAVLGSEQSGFDKVDVSDGDSDGECRAANGQVWSTTKALANPLAHPNCVRSFSPHVAVDDVTKGEHPGHAFRGNQYKGGSKLSQADVDHIQNYTADTSLNHAIRRGSLRPEQAVQRDAMDKAIAKHTLPEATQLYRIAPREVFGELKEGTTLADKGFVSTSKSKSSALDLIEEAGLGHHETVLFQINAPKGTGHIDVNATIPKHHFPEQKEVILGRDTKFKVTKVHTSPEGLTHVSVDVTP